MFSQAYLILCLRKLMLEFQLYFFKRYKIIHRGLMYSKRSAPFTDQAQLVPFLLHYYRCAGWRSMVVCLLEILDNRKRLNSALWNTSNLGKGLIYLIYLLRTMESENDRVSQAITRLRRELPHRVPRLWGPIPAPWNSRKHFKLLALAWPEDQYYY